MCITYGLVRRKKNCLIKRQLELFSSMHLKFCIPSATNNPVNTKHLYNIYTMLNQRRKRWANVVQMLYKCLCLLGRGRI